MRDRRNIAAKLWPAIESVSQQSSAPRGGRAEEKRTQVQRHFVSGVVPRRSRRNPLRRSAR